MAPRGLITQFEIDPDRLAAMDDCTLIISGSSLYEPAAEWPCNMLSRRTVVYGSGRIVRAGDVVEHAVDPGELALCQRLSSEVAALMAGMEVGMGSESSDEFQPFFIAGNVGEAVPNAISGAMIWERFGGTIFPHATIVVEPLAEQGVWWSEVKVDGADEGDGYFVPWRRMIEWFKGRSEFVDKAFVRIGEYYPLLDLPEEVWPEGTENTPPVFPRLALGLTRGGSLAGLFGWSVQS